MRERERERLLSGNFLRSRCSLFRGPKTAYLGVSNLVFVVMVSGIWPTTGRSGLF